jgi:hypothetical protein
MKTTARFFSTVIVVGLLGCGGGGGGPLGVAGAGGKTTGTGGTGGAPAGSAGAGGGPTIGGPTCGKVEPCGGNIVGTWKVENTCLANGGLVMDASDICAGATLATTSVTGTGTETFAADGTYHAMGTLSIGFKLTIPTSCFAPGKTCAGLTAEEQAQPSVTSASCATVGPSCVCQLTGGAGDETGTWTTSGTTLTTTPTGGTASTDPYCVQGNELHDIAVDMSMPVGSMGMAKIVGDIVYTRQ